MSIGLDLTPCGHLRTDSNSNIVYCDKCRPASQKQSPLSDEQATAFIAQGIQPLLETWLKSGKITPAQAAGNVMGMGLAIAVQSGAPKQAILQLVDACYGEEGEPDANV